MNEIDDNAYCNTSYDIKSLSIPESVRYIGKFSFENCCNLTKIIFPTTLTNIPQNTFLKIPILKELTISDRFEFHGDRLFIENNGCLSSVYLSKSIKMINNKNVYYNLSYIFTIPTTVTKVSDYCFANSKKLFKIEGIENIKEIGKGCFINCPELKEDNYQIQKENIQQYIDTVLTESEQKQIEEWSKLHFEDILFDSDVDEWDDKISSFNERLYGKKGIVLLVEDEKKELFGYYLSKTIKERNEYSKLTDIKWTITWNYEI